MRDRDLSALAESVGTDLRYGVRSLGRSVGFTLAAVAAITLGVGATAAVLSVVQGVLIQPLPYTHPERLVTILSKGRNPIAPGTFLDWRDQAASFERMGAAEYWTPNLTGVDEPEQVYALRMTADILPMLGISPMLGHVWSAADEDRGQATSVILSYALWTRRFASDSAVLGRTVRLDGRPYSVIGVMPPQFMFAPFWATHAELWAPLPLGARRNERGGGSLRVFARLKAGVSLEQARGEMRQITVRLDRQFPASNQDIRVTDLTQQAVGDVRTPLLTVLGASVCVLLIACANVAHMLLARGTARHREITVRIALGANRARITRQLLTESFVLAVLGGVGGVALARLGLRALKTLGTTSIPRADTVALNGTVLAQTALILLAATVLFGLTPALRAAATDLAESLRDGQRGSLTGSRRQYVRHALIASQVALAVMLLVGAGLLIRSVVTLESLDPGFDPNDVVTLVASVTGTAESAPGVRSAFYATLLDRIRAIPGVQAAGAVNHLPIGGDEWGWPFRVEGQPEPRPGEAPVASYKVVMPGYFHAMGIRLLAGRDVETSDNLTSPGVVVVCEFLARRYWPGETAVGKRVAFDKDSAGHPIWLTVVGIVHNTIHGHWPSPPEEEAYLPFFQQRDYLTNPAAHFSYLSIVVRGRRPAQFMPAIRAVIRSVDPNVTIANVRAMTQIVADETARPRFYLVVLGTFGAVALVLAATGIYGVMSYMMAQRTHEIGLRIALGAQPPAVLAQVVGQGMCVAAVGGALGALGVLAASRAMAALLFGVRVTDPLTLMGVVVVLGTVALLACYVPARRATRVDPLRALRSE